MRKLYTVKCFLQPIGHLLGCCWVMLLSIFLFWKASPSKKKCIIYSFGISNDWTFEDLMDSSGLSYELSLKSEQ